MYITICIYLADLPNRDLRNKNSPY